jgi:hypothetical protein
MEGGWRGHVLLLDGEEEDRGKEYPPDEGE